MHLGSVLFASSFPTPLSPTRLPGRWQFPFVGLSSRSSLSISIDCRFCPCYGIDLFVCRIQQNIQRNCSKNWELAYCGKGSSAFCSFTYTRTLQRYFKTFQTTTDFTTAQDWSQPQHQHEYQQQIPMQRYEKLWDVCNGNLKDFL